MILASFPAGATNITVNGLTQWDYGQKLKIQADDLPSMIEVHFWCVGMDEAVVRSCSVWKGEAEAAIPDRCLEQAGPIIAWVYEVYGSAGTTTKTITMPIIARVRPQTSATVPEDISDKYTEALTAMNNIVNEMAVGNVVAAHANLADRATNADNATRAGSAASADVAKDVTIGGSKPFKAPTVETDTLDGAGSGYFCLMFESGVSMIIYWYEGVPQDFRHPDPRFNWGVHIDETGALYYYDLPYGDYMPLTVKIGRLWG